MLRSGGYSEVQHKRNFQFLADDMVRYVNIHGAKNVSIHLNRRDRYDELYAPEDIVTL